LVDKSGLSLQSENHPLILHIGDRYRLAIGSPVNQDDLRKLLEVLENR
jgi:hypothetical protein